MVLETQKGGAFRMTLQWLAIGVFIFRLMLLSSTDHCCTTLFPPSDDWILTENIEKILLGISAALVGVCIWHKEKWPLSLYVSCLIVILTRCWGDGATISLIIINAPVILAFIPRAERCGAIVVAWCIFTTVNTEWCGMLACR